jgi:uncharacterized membrane protein YkoI
MEVKMKLAWFSGGIAALVLAAPVAHAQQSYKRDIPDSLARHAKISEHAAAKLAQKRVPKGTINGVELEREGGHLIYSYEFKVPGKTGIDEINVNALTGAIVSTEHEAPGAEAREEAAEAKKPKPRKP